MERIGHRWSIAASLSAVISALLASACCVGPLVFAVLGLRGAGLLLALEPFRAPFVALTLGLLGAGFYVTYREPRLAVATRPAGPACACAHPRAARLGRTMLWGSMALVVGILVFPYLAPYLFG